MAANGIPQSMLYNTGYGQLTNQHRDRSGEQAATRGAQTPMNYAIPQFNYGFDPTQASNLGRYVPPMMGSNGQGWQNSGGYSYNVPNSFGNYMGNYGGHPMQGVGVGGPSQNQVYQGAMGDQFQDLLSQLNSLYGGGSRQRQGAPQGAAGGRAPVPQIQVPEGARGRAQSFDHTGQAQIPESSGGRYSAYFGRTLPIRMRG